MVKLIVSNFQSDAFQHCTKAYCLLKERELDVGEVLFSVKHTGYNTLFIWNCKCLTLDERGASSIREKK